MSLCHHEWTTKYGKQWLIYCYVFSGDECIHNILLKYGCLYNCVKIKAQPKDWLEFDFWESKWAEEDTTPPTHYLWSRIDHAMPGTKGLCRHGNYGYKLERSYSITRQHDQDSSGRDLGIQWRLFRFLRRESLIFHKPRSRHAYIIKIDHHCFR